MAAGEAGRARGESEVMTSACAALTVGEMASMQSADATARGLSVVGLPKHKNGKNTHGKKKKKETKKL